MDISKIPKVFFHSLEHIAVQIVQAIKKDKIWAYSDFFTRFGAWLGTMLPARLRISIFFKELFCGDCLMKNKKLFIKVLLLDFCLSDSISLLKLSLSVINKNYLGRLAQWESTSFTRKRS